MYASDTLNRELQIARTAIASAPDGLAALEQQADRLARFDELQTTELHSALVVVANEAGLTTRHGRDTIDHIIACGLNGKTAFAKLARLPQFSVATAKSGPHLEVTCLSDVTPRPIEWLWPNRLAIGKVSVLAGDGGKGKSTILCDIAGRTTNGEVWPDGAPATAAGSVIILAAEDDVEDTLAPRLLAVGADMRRIFTIRAVRNEDQSLRAFNIQYDLSRLEAEIEKLGDVRLVIIDPISSYLGKVDSHKNAEVRSVLEPLAELASRLRVAVVCNNHFSKNGGNANSRIIGSVAFVNQARSALIVAPDADDPDRLLLMPSKMNNAPIKHGLAYRIEGALVEGAGTEILTSRIAWETTPVTISADAALAAHDDKGEDKTAKAEAIEFLQDRLSNGERKVEEVRREAKGAGITDKPLRSAKNALNVRSRREGFGPGAVWFWHLPDAIDAHGDHRSPRPDAGTYEGGGRL
jgi:putative DNA primase/helicase